jgi:hypothetical protein
MFHNPMLALLVGSRRDEGRTARTYIPALCSAPSVFSSQLEELEEPSGSNHIGSQGLRAPPQLTIRCNQCDHLTRGARSDINEHVVTAARGMEDGHTIGDATLDALARLAFQDHDDRLGDASRVNGRSYLVHERSGCSRSIPPPAGRTRPDHIRCINEKHSSSLIVPVYGGGTALRFEALCQIGRHR